MIEKKVREIIRDYRLAVEKENKERLEAQDMEKKNREINAGLAEKCVCDIISPVFHRVKDELVRDGFYCDVEIISKKDPNFSTSTAMAILIRLSVKPGTKNEPVNDSHLSYEGSFSDQGFTRTSIAYPRKGVEPIKEKERLVVSDINSSDLEAHLYGLLRRVFGV